MSDKPKMLLMTVYHTGSQYFYEGLAKDYDVSLHHCQMNKLGQIKDMQYDYIATTYRDPLLVGASWANRNKFNGRKQENDWFAMWGIYSYILAIAGVMVFCLAGSKTQHGVTFGDKIIGHINDVYLLHNALKEGDMDSYYKYCPREYIEYANYCSQAARI